MVSEYLSASAAVDTANVATTTHPAIARIRMRSPPGPCRCEGRLPPGLPVRPKRPAQGGPRAADNHRVVPIRTLILSVGLSVLFAVAGVAAKASPREKLAVVIAPSDSSAAIDRWAADPVRHAVTFH